MPAAREVGLVACALALTGGVACGILYLLQKRPAKEKKEQLITEHAHRATSTEGAAVTTEVGPVGTQVLVLGLDGSGKTSLLQCLSTGRLEQDVKPTQGFNAVSIHRDQIQIQFLEIGGMEKLREYWGMYLCKARVLVFVVDSSERKRFPLARRHLHQLLSAQPRLPLVLLAHKQDIPGACGVTELYDALDLGTTGDGHRLSVIGTQVKKGKSEVNVGVQDARDLIVEMMSCD